MEVSCSPTNRPAANGMPIGLAIRRRPAGARAAPAPRGRPPTPSAPSGASEEEWCPASSTESETASPGQASASPGRWQWRRGGAALQDSFWGSATPKGADEPTTAEPSPLQPRRPAGGRRLAARLTPAARASGWPRAPESVLEDPSSGRSQVTPEQGNAAGGAVPEPHADVPRGSGRVVALPAATVFEAGQDPEALLGKFMVRAKYGTPPGEFTAGGAPKHDPLPTKRRRLLGGRSSALYGA